MNNTRRWKTVVDRTKLSSLQYNVVRYLEQLVTKSQTALLSLAIGRSSQLAMTSATLQELMMKSER